MSAKRRNRSPRPLDGTLGSHPKGRNSFKSLQEISARGDAYGSISMQEGSRIWRRARQGHWVLQAVHVKSLPAHAVRSLIIARKKLVGQRATLENQIRGLAVVFGVRLPRALSTAFSDQALKASEGSRAYLPPRAG